MAKKSTKTEKKLGVEEVVEIPVETAEAVETLEENNTVEDVTEEITEETVKIKNKKVKKLGEDDILSVIPTVINGKEYYKITTDKLNEFVLTPSEYSELG